MIVFRNLNPIEVLESDGQIVLEIDPSSSGITAETVVEVSTIDGSAISTSLDASEGIDFNAIDNSTTLDPDDPDTLSFTIDIIDDAIAESTEEFQFQITSPEDANLSGVATINILDNDSTEVEGLLPGISLSNVEQLEGDSGNTNFEFTLSLSEASQESIAVDYATADGTGEAEDRLENGTLVDLADYIPATGTVEFNPGETEKTIVVEVLTDNQSILEEAPDETFFLNLSNASNGNIETLGATGTILDDDLEDNTPEEVEGLLPAISLSNVEQFEGDSGNTNFEFTLSLSEASQESISVDYATADGTGEAEDRLENGTLVDLADYIPATGTVEFNPGETEKTIVVEVLTDNQSILEEAPDETFFLNLSNASNGNIETLVATGTILDDDLEQENSNTELPFLQLDSQTFVEGDSGDNNSPENAQELTVNLVDSAGELFIATENITFSYSTTDITAAADVDYEAIATQSATITSGQSSITIPLTIIADDQVEADETFSVILSDIDPDLVQFSNGESQLATEITIENDDGIISDDQNPDGNSDLDSNDIRENTVFRFFDSATGGHFYTASEAEKDFVEDNLNNYELENPSYARVNPENSDNETDIFRFFNPITGGHFYTASEVERDFVINDLEDFVFEDVAFSAFETNVDDTIPVYRFFETTRGIHFYTADEAERTFVEDNLSNYDFEGIAFYALPL